MLFLHVQKTDYEKIYFYFNKQLFCIVSTLALLENLVFVCLVFFTVSYYYEMCDRYTLKQ